MIIQVGKRAADEEGGEERVGFLKFEKLLLNIWSVDCRYPFSCSLEETLLRSIFLCVSRLLLPP